VNVLKVLVVCIVNQSGNFHLRVEVSGEDRGCGGLIGISSCGRCSGPLPLMVAVRIVLLF
jgi:hypothetical protein